MSTGGARRSFSVAAIRNATRRPEHEFLVNRFYGNLVSPWFTMLCLRAGLSPDQVTILGGAFGALGVAILFLPLGPWSLLAVAALQVGYVLDFSDGQVARMTGRSSNAGAYLDWLTHFYIPVGAVLAVAASTALATGMALFLVLGTLAALELGSFGFSGKEHLLVAILRSRPDLGTDAAFHAALPDDARPGDVLAAPDGPATPLASPGILGRARVSRGPRAIVGELLIYPGAAHLITLAVIFDWLAGRGESALSARALILAAWAAAALVHPFLVARRNHAIIRAIEARRPAPMPATTAAHFRGPTPAGAPVALADPTVAEGPPTDPVGGNSTPPADLG